MRLELTKDSFGWLLGLRSSSSDEFAEALGLLKDLIPASCRTFTDDKRWRIALRAERNLFAWIDLMKARGAVVVDPTVRRPEDKPCDIRARLLLARAKKELQIRPEASSRVAEAVYPVLVAEHQGDMLKLAELASAIQTIRTDGRAQGRSRVA